MSTFVTTLYFCGDVPCSTTLTTSLEITVSVLQPSITDIAPIATELGLVAPAPTRGSKEASRAGGAEKDGSETCVGRMRKRSRIL